MKNKDKQKFDEDRFLGELAENKLLTALKRKGFTCIQTVGKNSDYDIEATKNGKKYTIEVKYDRKSAITGNVAVELYKTIRGKIENSGLSVTKADIIAYSFPNDDNFYLIETSKLRTIIKECKDVRTGGDGKRVTMGIYRVSLFKQWCRVFTGKKEKGFKIG